MRAITLPQLKIIHILLADLGITHRKPELVYSFTDGRTESSREMYLTEAKELIEYLKGHDKRGEIIKRIWHLSYELKIIQPGDQTENAINAATIDRFCLQRGAVKKRIAAQSATELTKTLRQFEAMHGKFQQKEQAKARLTSLRKKQREFIEKEMYEKASEIQMEIQTLL